ncbi:MAG: DNA mismatch repair protein MutS [Clostridia bacterium]|nr:DNA mismatch repair protein MutS [Clostridia bacterium]
MAELSPMMRQYMQIKDANADAILFFRLGDFYEMFFDDAITASRELDLTLTGKDCGLEERAPMCGVPYHSCEGYIARLVERGYKVAVCEQTEDPSKAKGLVKRDIVRIITPGTVIDGDMLEEGSNNYLAAVCRGEESIGLCFADVSTGECRLTEISGSEALLRAQNEIMRFLPRELLLTSKLQSEMASFLGGKFEGSVTVRGDNVFGVKASQETVCNNFGVVSPENLGIKTGSAMQCALGAAIDYIKENSVGSQITVKDVKIYGDSEYMRLDITATRNLELVSNMRSSSRRGSLLGVLDKTKTAMGKRMLKGMVLQPLTSISRITARQNAVEELLSLRILRGEVMEYMSGVRDVDRIMTRVVYATASPKDLISIANTARMFPLIKSALSSAKSKLLVSVKNDIDTLENIVELIDAAISEVAPVTLREGKLIKKGYSKEVDELRLDMEGGSSRIAEIEARERERTGIKTLRVRYNKVFGYYIEVTNSFLDKVPEDYIRRQTLVGGERFITEELKNLEERLLTAKDRDYALEYEMFNDIRAQVAKVDTTVRHTAEAIAKLDVLCSLATVAEENGYCRPVIDGGDIIRIEDGRHPVVEKYLQTPFVANDTFLNNTTDRSVIITGPNMAGKSTYMRQVALITVMAQIGSFVPAKRAQIGVVDAVYTRVGASDDLSSGQSTFMVEMTEVAEILKNATRKSLIIFDEIGRGTSTFDGMAIARAVLEYVNDKRALGAKALFATHYHELTEMENGFEGVKNYNIAVKKRGDDIIFLRRIVPGGADDSYGIEVAKLGGIPDVVIKRAKQILKKTLENGVVTYKVVKESDSQMSIENACAADILGELKSLDVNTLTPIEAMSTLFDLVKKAKSV